MTWVVRVRAYKHYLGYVSSRVVYHLAALPSLCWSAVRWLSPGAQLGAQFWRFYVAFAVFNLGLFIFFLLYNLYLLQLGFQEDFLGLVVSAMTAGSIAGSLLAALAIRRFGLRNTLVGCFASISCSAALRALATTRPALLSLAFVSGILTSSWAVSLSPAVAQLTAEKSRPLAFSFIFSTGIMIGVLGGIAGGQLPGLFSRFGGPVSSVSSYRGALLVACFLVLLAIWPLIGVKLGDAPPSERRFFRPSPLLARFLICVAAWHLGTGLFNPFFNVFFARLQMPVAQIGTVFSLAHVAQAVAVLMAPIALKKFGLTRGVSGMQFVTALALVAIACATGPIPASLAFIAFTMAQYMTEPGMFTFLMDAVPPAERGNASAFNFLVTYTAQAIVAALAGRMLAHLGYPPVLVTAAVLCAVAALLLRLLLADRKPSAPSGS
jgi:MFS family permease